MEMHDSATNTYISLAREFQKHISDPIWAHGLLDNSKDRSCASTWNCTEREYHVQDRKYVPHTSVKLSREKIQFPALSFCGPHKKIMD